MTQTTDLKAIADALRRHDRFLVVTHENPDGDALGSMLAVSLALRQLGKHAVMYLPGETPLPREYAFMPLEDLVREPPADSSERVLLAVDCAKEDRIGDEAALARASLVLDIDHHHDNTRFGDLNLIVADASSTGEVLRDVFAELGVELTPELAEQLHGPHAYKGSLRSSIDELDVSAIAHSFGGGGHRQAAGFSSDATLEEIVERIRLGFLEQRATSRA